MFAVATYGWFVRAVSPNICVCRIDEIRHDGLFPHNEDFFSTIILSKRRGSEDGAACAVAAEELPCWGAEGCCLEGWRGQFFGGAFWGVFRGWRQKLLKSSF